MEKTKKLNTHQKILIGRNEWCQIPNLNIPAIKAKIDTGAKTSSIHAFNIKPVTKENQPWVQFDIHPIQGNEQVSITCTAPIVDKRHIMSSSGHKEDRYIIKSALKMGDLCWEVEFSLSNRDPLRYRMLLGRQALNSHVLIDPYLSCHLGHLKKREVMKLYADINAKKIL